MRRPDLFTAAILAGLLWLGAVEPAWSASQRGSGAPLARPEPAALASPEAAARMAPASLPAAGRQTQAVPASHRPLDYLFRFLAGGLLAGLLWSFLFGYPFYSYWPDDPVPLGLLDLTVLVAGLYLGYAVIKAGLRSNRIAPQPAPSRFQPQASAPLVLGVDESAEPGLAQIDAGDADFDLAKFGEFAHRVIADLHAAWNRQDLQALHGLAGPDLLEFLQLGLKILSLRGEISRLDDLTLKRLVVSQAGRAGEREFITLRLEGEVMDYVLARQSYKLLCGSLTYPIQLKECWCFERRDQKAGWMLTDIRDY